MLQINLFLELVEVVTQLLEVDADSSSTHEARQLIDSLVADFEEAHGVMAEEASSISQELNEYYQIIENFQSLNNILACGLPSLNEPEEPELAKLRIEIFAILNDLLKVGVTSCNVHEAHMNLDALLAQHEQIQDMEEDCSVDDFDSLDHLFAHSMTTIEKLTIICESGVDIDAFI